jgi:hypothetical protein
VNVSYTYTTGGYGYKDVGYEDTRTWDARIHHRWMGYTSLGSAPTPPVLGRGDFEGQGHTYTFILPGRRIVGYSTGGWIGYYHWQ